MIELLLFETKPRPCCGKVGAQYDADFKVAQQPRIVRGTDLPTAHRGRPATQWRGQMSPSGGKIASLR